jgi:D-glycero-D-manno-heptose 1,7-bisphosphate phosphatase
MTAATSTSRTKKQGVGGRATPRNAATRPLVFLDKDGTLIEDLPYNVDPRRIRFAPGAREAIRLLGQAQATLVVVTNQSGIARGYFTEDDMVPVVTHLRREVAELGANLTAFYYCPHLDPELSADRRNDLVRVCDCRKPAAGLITKACRELGLDAQAGWFVGDTWMDVAAGRRAGCRTIMVGPEARTASKLPDDRRPLHAVDTLLDAARIILGEGDRG